MIWCGMACATYGLIVYSAPGPSADCEGLACMGEGDFLFLMGVLYGVTAMAAGLAAGAVVLGAAATVVRVPRALGSVLGVLCIVGAALSLA